MHKYLSRHGNAYALVIDKPLRALLDITPETTPPEELTVRQIVMELFETHGMNRDHVTAVHALARPCFSPVYAVGWADGLANVATQRDVAIIRRYHALLRARRSGVAWDAAVQGALGAHPLPAD